MKETIIVDKDVFRDMMANQRQDVRKMICSADEAKTILGCNDRKFMELNQDPETKIKKTKIHGKYSLQSIYDEAKRLIQ